MLNLVGPSEELYEVCLKTCFLSGNKKRGHLPTGSDLLLVKGGLIGFGCSGLLAGACLRVEQC